MVEQPYADRSTAERSHLYITCGGQRYFVGQALTLFGMPVRLDATLCAPDELWIEGPTGEAVRVWPAPAKDPADA